MRYEITNDDHRNESPLKWGEWELHSFSNRHTNFKHPDEFGISVNQYGEVETDQVGLRRKLECGTAFILGYYEHGICSWFLKGCGTECQWDGTQVAGILMWTGRAKDLGNTGDERRKYASAICESYNQWCNGEIYQYNIYDDNNEIVDSCGSIYGHEYAEQLAREEMEGMLCSTP